MPVNEDMSDLRICICFGVLQVFATARGSMTAIQKNPPSPNPGGTKFKQKVRTLARRVDQIVDYITLVLILNQPAVHHLFVETGC